MSRRIDLESITIAKELLTIGYDSFEFRADGGLYDNAFGDKQPGGRLKISVVATPSPTKSPHRRASQRSSQVSRLCGVHRSDP